MRGKAAIKEDIGVAIAGIGSPAYESVDTWAGSKVIAYIAGGVAGDILVGQMEFWDSSSDKWVSTPPTLPLDSDIGFRVPVVNTGGYKQHMKLRANVARPGKTSGVDIEVRHPLNPGETRFFEFGTDFFGVYNFPSGSEVGDYTVVELILYADIY